MKWPPKFSERQHIDISLENKPYIELLKENTEIDDEDHDSIREFMSQPGDSDICQPAVDLVEKYCFGITLETLHGEGTAGKLRRLPRVALLDERCYQDGEQVSRAYRGPLTAYELYQELKRPRFRCHSPITSVESADTSEPSEINSTRLKTAFANSGPSQGGSKADELGQQDWECDADRRVVFITDLDQWTIRALICTGSLYQAPALRDAIHSHLASKALLGVTFSANNLQVFQLSFHLPYFALRTSTAQIKDSRQDKGGEPLRRSYDVTFLDTKHEQLCAFLYEAQISVVISGTDEWRWVGYCFVDTYFDADHEDGESVDNYHQDSVGDDGMLMDPCTHGRLALDRPIQEPREYFLEVLRCRLHQVRCEWQQVLQNIKESIREHEQVPGALLVSAQGQRNKDPTRSSYDWSINVINLCMRLHHSLEKTVQACERFRLQATDYFQCVSISEILYTMNELDMLDRELDALVARCKFFARMLETRLALDAEEAGNQQRQAAQDLKGLSTLMMFLVSPITLTLSIFSLDPYVTRKVLPFIPLNFVSFCAITLIFIILEIILHSLGEARFQFQAPLQKLLTRWSQLESGEQHKMQWEDHESGLAGFRGCGQAKDQDCSLASTQYRKPRATMKSSPTGPQTLTPVSEKVSEEPPSLFLPKKFSYSAPFGHQVGGGPAACMGQVTLLEYFDDSNYTCSPSNRFKLYCERAVRQQLIWWPFEEPIRPLPPGMSRMAYICACGSKVSFDVLSESNNSGASSRLANLFTRRNTTQPLLPLSTQYVAAADHDQTAHFGRQLRPSSQDQYQQEPAVQHSNFRGCERFIYLCVGSNACSQLFELNVRDHDDHSFIVKVQQTYAQAIGWWYSFWTMSSCGGIAVKKFHRLSDRNLVTCGGKSELPRGLEYEYDGHPTDECVERLESTASHRMQMHSGICWPWRSRCRSSSACSPFDPFELLSLIPKRKGAIDHQANDGYGMQPITRIAIWKLIVGSLLGLGGPVGFMIYWLQSHPGDIQSSWTPFSAVVIVFAVYLDILFRSFR